jgi:hypothetical protein
VLHPACKADYFKKQGWEPAWIEEARELARLRYNVHYKPAAPTVTVVKVSTLCTVQHRADVPKPKNQSALALLDTGLGPATTVNELEEYLTRSRETCEDPIEYWRARLPSPLAQMALDFLTVPGKLAIDRCKVPLRASCSVICRRRARLLARKPNRLKAPTLAFG